ncbi:MAG: hypothetical protein EON96_13915 [Caulobacteraceae bacterium]|nr:MAG: hypothetical protein EON96_13915 [Caulobacteraceae bacterium]
MPDGGLNLTLSDDETSRLLEQAEAAGVSPEALASELLARLLDDPTASTRPATTAADYEGPFTELEDALAEFDAELDRRRAARGA